MDVEAEDLERGEIRSELSKLSFEDLQKLKAKLGARVYNEAMFGTKRVEKTEYKRANKNRPREISSKRREPIKISQPKSNLVRDPRFDSLSGTFDEKRFRSDYKFLSDIRQREKDQLVTKLKTEKNSEERKKVKSLLQRMRNQEREDVKKQRKEEKKIAIVEEKVKALKDGKKPYFQTKLEKKVVDLVDQFSELKKSGKLLKHIERKRKKLSQKEKKRGLLDNFSL